MVLSIEEIKSFTKQIISTKEKTYYNNIVKLVNELIIPSTNDQVPQLVDDLENEKRLRFLTVSLFQIFKKLFQRNELVLLKKNLSTQNQNEPLIKFINWCRNMYNVFKLKLLAIISDLRIETSWALDALDLYLQLIELESEHFAKGPFFPNKTLQNLMISLWKSDVDDHELDPITGQSQNFILLEFINKYYKPYADIQYYTQSELNKLFDTFTETADGSNNTDGNNSMSEPQLSRKNNIAKWLTLMNHDQHCCGGLNTDNENKFEFEVFVSEPPNCVNNVSQFKSLVEKNWLFQLNQELSFNQYKSILLILHRRVIPLLHTPTKLMDFLTDSYNLSQVSPNDKSVGVIPILALNGLFQLMQHSNLEYPNFYSKLYQLLTPDLMHVKYRPRFFRLMELFLSSTHLSVHLVASFIKKLARLSLNAPPAAVVTIIPFIYNLLKKHPNCMIMIHNPKYISSPFLTDEERLELKQNIDSYKDPFDINSTDPENTNAFESSLWELATLMDHYHPNVATLAKIFKQPFRKLHYNMEDFLDWSYDSLVNAELSRNLKILPTLEFETFDQILNEHEFGTTTDSTTTYLKNIAW
ncbi:ribosome biosynthesis protein NOC4 PWA37_000845 [Arxiozyma heterogenica]|uniref:ribosome biosynthesis protein NOC4 n=1 Tax=Arxiozyma heterogenica TaxID=278026 RepID=UPI002F00224C